ncbi:trypsin-like peptidase domain-containing protein [uncultured Tateyamaria sp.]|uniref:trypsin-like peptidase domain-containing protein n=1 Tax=uncultured Tateyamaria sp. TaxID=455651 RepID=UPI002615D563|nr:trypsin-like peptidase domain-containing protein [uncultured Tateyamaria sp.]
MNQSGTLEGLASAVASTATNEGLLRTAEHYRDDAEENREVVDQNSEASARLNAEIDEWNEEIAALSEVISDPVGTRKRLDERIELGVERARAPRPSSEPETTLPFVFRPPIVAPDYFENRQVETEIICNFLRSHARNLLTVIGRGGVGKSALVCRVLKEIERGNLPDDLGRLSVAGIVYLSYLAKEPSLENLMEGLARATSNSKQNQIRSLMNSAQLPTKKKVSALLEVFSGGSRSENIIVLMDNMEDGIDPTHLRIIDKELREFLGQLVSTVDTNLRVILTSRISPEEFRSFSPRARVNLPLDEGLEFEHAENLFRSLDENGAYGVKEADRETLRSLTQLTRGYPRAIEAVIMILGRDRYTSISDLVETEVTEDSIVEVLVGEAFSRLDNTDQLVMEALAVFGVPVPPTAVEFVLRPWIAHVDGALFLNRLANLLFVRKEGEFYFQHPVDRDHAYRVLEKRSQVELLRTSDESDRISIAKLTALAADYFEQVAIPKSDWRSLSDILPNIRQFDLRLKNGDDDTAMHVLDDVAKFMEKRGDFERLLRMASELHMNAASKPSRKSALQRMALAHWRIGQISDALRCQELRIQEFDPEDEQLIYERANLRIFGMDLGRYSEAVGDLEKLVELTKSRRWQAEEASVALDHLADVNEHLGDLDSAISQKEMALEKARETGDLDREEAQIHNLAITIKQIGDFAKASDLLHEALRIADESENPLWRANHLSSIALTEWEYGNHEQAKETLDKAKQIRKEIGNLSGIASDLLDECKWNLVNGDIETAERNAAEARQSIEDLGRPKYQSDFCLASIAAAQGNWAEALSLARAALRTNTEEGTWARKNLTAIAALHLGDVQLARTNFQSAFDETSERIRLCARNVKAFSHNALSGVGLALLGEESIENAKSSYKKARVLLNLKGTLKERKWWFDLIAQFPTEVDLNLALAALEGSPTAPKKSPTGPGYAEINPAPSSQDLPYDVREAIVRLITSVAVNGPGHPRDFFSNLILRANLPKRLQSTWRHSLGSDPEGDARKFVIGMSEFTVNPKDGNNALGTVLLALLPDLSVEDAVFVSATLVGQRLIQGESQRDEIATRYQVPLPFLNIKDSEPQGHSFDWSSPADDTELQSWLRPQTDFLDVLFLHNAVNSARSVCRIEVDGVGEGGTGFLVSDRFILTSFHVLGKDLDSVYGNIRRTKFHFGSFATAKFEKGEGQIVFPDALEPLASFSRVEEHDFALLRTSDAIFDLVGIRPAEIETALPKKDDAIHILQHPRGGPMKLAISDNGVGWVSEESGKVQYATRTAGGSSGSPCFDQNWKVVALHRAEQARSFGSVREGVLLHSIIPKIEKYLNS